VLDSGQSVSYIMCTTIAPRILSIYPFLINTITTGRDGLSREFVLHECAPANISICFSSTE